MYVNLFHEKTISHNKPIQVHWKCFQKSNKPIRSLILTKRDILESIPKTHQHKEKVSYLFEQFESQSFWKKLNVSIRLMSPLVLFVDRMQANNVTVSWSVALLLYCYPFYSNHCSDIGHRWNFHNKHAYLIAYFLNLKFFVTVIKVDWFSLSMVVDELYSSFQSCTSQHIELDFHLQKDG